MRDAQSLLEQVLSYAAPGAGAGSAGALIDESLLQEILGVAERKVLYDLSNAVVQGDGKKCVELVADVVAQGWDIPRLSRELAEHFRNLLVVRLTQESPSSSFSRLLDLPDQEVGELKRQATGLSVDTLLDYFRFMARGDEEVARSAYPRFALETVLVRLATLPKAAPIAEILERLEKMERRLSGGAGHNRLRRGGEERAAAEKPEPEEGPPESGSAENGAEEVWRKFVAFVMREKKILGSHLEQVRPLEMPPGPLKIGVGERYHFTYLQDPENMALLKELAGRFFSQEVAVGITSLGSRKPELKNGGQGIGDAPKAESDSGGDIVKEALRIFGGSVRGIKRET